MVDLQRVRLPGVGVLHRYETDEGATVEVISHRSGYSDLTVVDDDKKKVTLRLDSSEARALAELLGGTQVTESISALANISGLAIDWYAIESGDFIDGKYLEDPRNIGITGLVVVAVVRNGEAEPVPSGRLQVFAGDTLIIAGEPRKVARSFSYFHTGELNG